MKYILFSYLFFVSINTTASDTVVDTAIGSVSKQSALIGTTVKDLQIGKSINLGHIKNISQFRGKPYIISFWEPWCSPCIKAFAKYDTIKQRFGSRIQILSVTKATEKYATTVLHELARKNKVSQYSSIVDDTLFNAIFKHKYIPHYVWVDSKGVITAITDEAELSFSNINSFINNRSTAFQEKRDSLIFLNDEPSFLNTLLVQKKDLVVQSTLTKYIQGLSAESARGKNYIRCTSNSIHTLYKIAFGQFNFSMMGNNRMILDSFVTTSDSLAIGFYTDRTMKHFINDIMVNVMFNYELYVNDTVLAKRKFSIMAEDLNRYFAPMGIRGYLRQEVKDYYGLIRTSNSDKIKSISQTRVDQTSDLTLVQRRVSMRDFISKFQASYYKDGALPVLDETGYRDYIDIEIKADLTDIEKVNEQLVKYDLQFVRKSRSIPMIVIEKRTVK